MYIHIDPHDVHDGRTAVPDCLSSLRYYSLCHVHSRTRVHLGCIHLVEICPEVDLFFHLLSFTPACYSGPHFSIPRRLLHTAGRLVRLAPLPGVSEWSALPAWPPPPLPGPVASFLRPPLCLLSSAILVMHVFQWLLEKSYMEHVFLESSLLVNIVILLHPWLISWLGMEVISCRVFRSSSCPRCGCCRVQNCSQGRAFVPRALKQFGIPQVGDSWPPCPAPLQLEK